MFAFIILLTFALGVLWKVVEFAVAEAAAVTVGVPVLTRYGLRDTLLDLAFDTIGAVLVATWGTAYLSDVVGAIAERFEARAG